MGKGGGSGAGSGSSGGGGGGKGSSGSGRGGLGGRGFGRSGDAGRMSGRKDVGRGRNDSGGGVTPIDVVKKMSKVRYKK